MRLRSDATPVELFPKSVVDPYATASPAIRVIANPSPADQVSPTTLKADTLEDEIRYCDQLFEVPALKGVHIAQAVAGDRSSYVRTSKEGRVLGWGANEFGQMALGGSYTVDSALVPTEIVLSRSYPVGTNVKCLDITAGGDVVYFTVESFKGAFPSTGDVQVDLLAAGMGQYGSLGNAAYIQAQSTPVKVRGMSGIKEYNESTGTTQPLAPKLVSASPTGHTLALLDTFELDGTAQSKDRVGRGRDILVWGLNTSYQLGLGKRSSIALPTPLPSAAFVGGYDVDESIARMMARERTVDVLKDLDGKKVAKKAKVEQTVVAGWGCSAMYWKVV